MKKISVLLLLAFVLGVSVDIARAGGVKYANEHGDYVKLGGRIQLQYHMTDPETGDSTDELLFRRLRPFIEGSIHKDWNGKFQFDLGKGEVAVKDAYFSYKGFKNADITIGNANFCFSRELLTSSKYQQLVERTFVGDHNYGTPDRQAGLHMGGNFLNKALVWNAGVAKAALDPSNKKLDFDTIIQHEAGDDWLKGNMFGGRMEVFPMGSVKHSQGNFERSKFKTAFAVGAFAWQNDDDNVNMDVNEESGATTVSHSDVDSVTGVELSAALRLVGLSVDAEYNMFDADLVNGKAGADGIYRDGKTTLENFAVECGYMLVPSRFELVAGYENQDADGYAKAWNRTSVGANIFVAKHDIKYQVTYRMSENNDGKDGNDANEVFVQAQYVF